MRRALRAMATPTAERWAELKDPAVKQAGMLNLGKGMPSPDLLPCELVAEGARASVGAAVSAADREAALQYGPGRGPPAFLRHLAELLTQEAPGHTVDPHRLMLTNGSSMGLQLTLTRYCRHGDCVLTSASSYFLALEVMRQFGLKIVDVPMDEQGCLVDELEAILEARASAGLPAPRLFYCQPTFQNPTGVTMPADRRRKLVQLARRFRFRIVSDDVYTTLWFSGPPPPPPPMSFFDDTSPDDDDDGDTPPTENDDDPDVVGRHDGDPGLVVSLGTFSKILAPGVRLGWIEAHRRVVHSMGRSGFLRSGGGLNPLVAAMVGALLSSGRLQLHLQSARREYEVRCRALCAAVRQHAPSVQFVEPAGGYFVWCRVPGLSAANLLKCGREAGVLFQPGPLFAPDGRSFDDWFRLSFAYYAVGELNEAAQRLGVAVKAATMK